MTDLSPLLEVRDVSKRFPGVQALDKVSLSLHAGEILALVGENGAGKSTLMKILSGVYQPDAGGAILMNGVEVSPQDPIHARDTLGISIIYQEFNLAPNLSVAENIFLGRAPKRFGFVMFDHLFRQANALLAMLNVDLDARAPVSRLSVAQQQMVEIAKALAYQAKLVIMDEPTAALSPRETQTLFEIMRRLRDKGVGIIFITHRLDEVFQVTDRITVMRDGRTVGGLMAKDADRNAIVRLMVDRDVSELYPTTKGVYGDVLLEVKNLSTPGRLQDISFSLRRGEILGIFGLLGAGRTEVANALFGVGPRPTGQILLNGTPIDVRSPADATQAGVCYVPEDRKRHGLVLGMAVRENISLAVLRQISRTTFVRQTQERRLSDDFINQLGIRTPSREQRVNNLSGGNQQKVVLAKWLANSPRVLILDEPTRGIDVGAKAEVHAIATRLADEGVGMIMISSELPEVLGMSDRILVIHEGRVTGEFARTEATKERIMMAATGVTANVGSGIVAPAGYESRSCYR
jgi:ribose transport system ATP-binding protein